MINIEPNNSSLQVRMLKLAIVVIAIIGFVIWQRYFAPTLEEETFETVLPIAFHGKIDSIYRDKANHDVEKVVISDGYAYEVDRLWEQYLSLGDSLSKDKGNLKIKVYRKNRKELILDYKELVKKFNKAWWQR